MSPLSAADAKDLAYFQMENASLRSEIQSLQRRLDAMRKRNNELYAHMQREHAARVTMANERRETQLEDELRKVRAEYLAYRERCNRDGTAPKRRRRNSMAADWAKQRNASPKGIFDPSP